MTTWDAPLHQAEAVVSTLAIVPANGVASSVSANDEDVPELVHMLSKPPTAEDSNVASTNSFLSGDDNDDPLPPDTLHVVVLEMPEHLENMDSGWGGTEMHQITKDSSIAIINRLCVKPVKKSHIYISLCQLQTYPKVRPINGQDVKWLMNEFNEGYYEGNCIMYVSVFNRKKEKFVKEDNEVN